MKKNFLLAPFIDSIRTNNSIQYSIITLFKNNSVTTTSNKGTAVCPYLDPIVEWVTEHITPYSKVTIQLNNPIKYHLIANYNDLFNTFKNHAVTLNAEELTESDIYVILNQIQNCWGLLGHNSQVYKILADIVTLCDNFPEDSISRHELLQLAKEIK